MKRRKWYIGILILCLFLIVVGVHLYFSSESYIRERYPYRVNALIGFDPSTPSYLTLEHLIGPNDAIIHGKFTGEKENPFAHFLHPVLLQCLWHIDRAGRCDAE